MAHDYVCAEINRVGLSSMSDERIMEAWRIADKMQAEEDKRKVSGVPEAIRENSHIFGSPAPVRPFLTKDKDGNCTHFHHEFGHKKCMDCGACLEQWQPDWSQAPDGYKWWAFDGYSKGANWYNLKPWIDDDSEVEDEWNADLGSFLIAPSFGYKGDWKDSLRKRP